LKKPDPSDWLTKAQVADVIGVSTKTVEKLAADKQLQQASVRRAGKPPIVVYHPGDVERVRKERNPEGDAFVVPPSQTPEMVDGKETAVVPRTGEPTAAGAFASLMNQFGNGARVRLSERMFLNIKEASELTGLTQIYLTRRIKDGTLPAIRDGAWKIRRSDLEKL
jgi:excisionase family DNA binding protein